MDAVKAYLAAQNVQSAPYLLESFYLSLKTRPFVMVLGRGDTDMAKLPRLFAEGVGATEKNGRYLQLQVPMDWMDSSDLFGHLNLEGKFIPGAITDFLKTAQNDPDRPYFLCLDRIILSRAEYYLREVLTSVETGKPLVPVIYYGRDGEALEKYGQIPALENLYIVGTSNLDEASLPLNQKLLDKVHTIYLQPGDIAGAARGTAVPLQKHNGWLKRRYRSVGDCLEQAQEYFPLFADLNQILTQANAYMGYQMRNDAVLFLLHNDVMPKEAAEDQMICQKVLTRVQGSEKAVGAVLCKLQEFCAGKYPKAEAATRRMINQCKTENFGSYWN